MFQIKAQSRLFDLSGTQRVYYVLLIGVFISIVSFLAYRNIIVTVTLLTCTVGVFILLSQPPQEMEIGFTQDGLLIDNGLVPWQDAVSWSVGDMGEDLEFTIKTTNFTQDYIYFYIQKGSVPAKQAVEMLMQNIPYDQSIADENLVHNTLRRLGLK